MELREFESREVSLDTDFIGFPSIREELQDIVKYLAFLNTLSQEGKHDHKKLLLQSECGSLFLGRTGAGKTHALHCIVNEAKEIGYCPVDGSTMLKRERVNPGDIGEFFDECKARAEEQPLLIAYDDVKQLLGLSSRVRERMREEFGRDAREDPMLEEVRRQLDRLGEFTHPAYIILTSVERRRHVDDQLARRLSRHVIFSTPSDSSRNALFEYYLRRVGYNPDSIDIIALSYLTNGVVAGKVKELVSRSSYKASMEGGLTDKVLVREITRFLHGPPVDISLTEEDKIQTGYHEFGGHTLLAYLVGLEPILVTIEPSADGTIGKSIHRPSERVPASSSKYFFAHTITLMGSTAVYTELKKGREEGRSSDLFSAARSALELYALKNPTIKMRVGWRGTYLTRGLPSEEGKRDVEEEVERITQSALHLATAMVTRYQSEMEAFVEDHLIQNETMIRRAIIATLTDLGVESGAFYSPMSDALNDLGYLG
jgi:SpoVK/Ycf46/Vps4 family AAA+-type ATPase